MPEEILCPYCNQTIEDGAIYCGNCGYKLNLATQPSTVQQIYDNDTGSSSSANLKNPLAVGANSDIPAYAIPSTHHKQHWAAMAIAFGIIGLAGGILIPIIGLAFGVTGIVLATSSYRITHGWLKLAGLIVCIIAILVSTGFWVNRDTQNLKATKSNQVGTSNGIATINVSTPCYTLSFNTILNVNNNSGSCSLNAYNGKTFQDSSDIYKIVAEDADVNKSNFYASAKKSINNDITQNLSGYSIVNQSSSIFDGSPAYYEEAYNSSSNASLIEEGILNSASTKDNYYLIIHAVNGPTVNIDQLERTWQWVN